MITASVKLTEDQMGILRRDAHAKCMSISDYLRSRLFPEKKPKPPKIIPKRHPVSGCWYNAAPGQANPTREKLREALEDIL
jgi:hypothetical protein